MIVVSLTNCPPKLRGDLTKWLIEINAGVYVGRVSARVRDELWQRICENVKEGRATMVFSANNEQGMDFYVHNTTWKPVEFDGITLMGYDGKQMNTVRQDFYHISSRAVEEVKRLMDGQEGQQVVMPYSVVKMYYKDIIC